MKPGDHPDFFRFAPPPGTSRESTITLDREGRFFHNGERVLHPSLEKALRTWISRHPDDGRPILTNGYDWCYFHPDTTSLFVETVTLHANGTATLRFFDGTEEPLDPRSLTLDDDGVVRTRNRAGTEARFMRHAQTALAPLLVEGDPPTLQLGSQRFEIRTT